MNIKNSIIINSYLSFKLGNEIFAAHASKVLNILEMPSITEVPMAPSYIKGIINLRGTVLPVIDLRLKLGMPAFQKTANTCIIVLDITIDKDPVQIGAIVDSVQAVHEIDKSVILAPPSIGSKYRSEFIVGVANINDSFIMVLDMDSIFSLDEIADFQNQIDNITHIEKIETIE